MIIAHRSIETSGATFETRVESFHFGSGFEARGTSLANGSSVSEILTQIRPSLLRYPGGSHTEAYFDPSNPNDPRPINLFTGTTVASFAGITEFVSLANEIDSKIVMVIPTYRYFSKSAEDNSFITESAEVEIYRFVQGLLLGEYGSVNVHAFEIGNEWFNSRMLYSTTSNPDGWTASEFGELSSRIVEIVDSAIRELSLQQEPEIWVQSGQTGNADMDASGLSDNFEILSAFSDITMPIIDGVVDHFYQPTRGDDPMEVLENGWVASNRIARLIEDGWNITGADALNLVTTEWNIRAARNGNLVGDEANITGFERLPLFLGLMADMVASGVDLALAYTAQGIGPDGGSGTLSRFRENSLTPTGMLFDLMSNSLPGSYLRDPNGDGTLSREEYIFQDENGVDAGLTFTFEKEGEVVVYFASATNDSINLSLGGFSSLTSTASNISASVIRVLPGSNPLDANVDGYVEHLTAEELDGLTREDGVIEFTLGPYEVIQIVSESAEDELVGAFANSRYFDSNFAGTLENDLYFGLLGHDNIDVRSGNDSVYGSFGDDLIRGRDGNDLLCGQDGDDFLFGGPGEDALYGAAGNDTLRGGSGSDLIGGGAGDDSLDGEGGNDTIYTARGNDTALGGAGDDMLGGFYGDDSLLGGQGNDQLWGAAGNDTLSGGSEADRLGGGSGNDSLMGDAGADEIFGGPGADTMLGGTGDDTLYGAGGNDRIGGEAGNDLLYPGAGADEIIFSAGRDRVLGFAPGEDRVDLRGLGWATDFATLRATRLAATTEGVLLSDSDGNSLLLEGLSLNQMHADVFLFG